MIKLPLNILYLKYFFDAVRSGSISAAARLNHVSQSAASQGIAKLEVNLNSSLISHQPNRFRVTEEGKMLYESAKEIFRAIQKTEDSFSGGKQVTLTFACTHSFALSCLPKMIQLARKTLPHIRLNFRLGQYFAIKDMIKKGIVDFGILIDNDDLSAFDCYHLREGEYRLWVAKNKKDYKSIPFLLDNEERAETNQLKALYKKLHKKELPVFMEVSSWAVVCKLAEEGLGIALAPDYVIQDNNKLKPVFPELNPRHYKLYAVFEKNNIPSSYAQSFIELLRDKYTYPTSKFGNLTRRHPEFETCHDPGLNSGQLFVKCPIF